MGRHTMLNPKTGRRVLVTGRKGRELKQKEKKKGGSVKKPIKKTCKGDTCKGRICKKYKPCDRTASAGVVNKLHKEPKLPQGYVKWFHSHGAHKYDHEIMRQTFADALRKHMWGVVTDEQVQHMRAYFESRSRV
jgi:hypothetical protein